MSLPLIGIFLAIGSSVAYGSADFFGGLGARHYSPYQVLFISEIVGMLTMGLLSFASREPSPDMASVFWCILGNLIGIVGLAFLYDGLARGGAAIVSPVAGVIGGAIPVLLAILTSGWPAPAPLIGFIIALPGIWLVTAVSQLSPEISKTSLRLGLLAGIAFGLFFIFMARVKSEGVFASLAVGRAVAIVVVFGVLKLRKEILPSPLQVPQALATGILDVTGNATYMLANQYTRLDVAVVLTSLYPAVTVFLSGAVLKEPIHLKQWVGVALCIAAIALIAM